VGAPGASADSTSAVAGHAYVFDAPSGNLVSTLDSPSTKGGGEFGWSVAISGTTVVVGAPSETPGTLEGAGQAYVFDATTGGLLNTLDTPTPEAFGRFGFSVGVFFDGGTIVVGAPGETGDATAGAGRAYLF
jgi:hypothetical protein